MHFWRARLAVSNALSPRRERYSHEHVKLSVVGPLRRQVLEAFCWRGEDKFELRYVNRCRRKPRIKSPIDYLNNTGELVLVRDVSQLCCDA